MSFIMKYDVRNRANLDKLSPNTKAAAYKWYQYCIDNQIDILIYETIRTIEKQRENVANGKSQTMKSYHLEGVGQALDFVPIINGNDDWGAYKKEPFISAIKYAKSIGFEWGGDWKGFVDSPHLQFNYKGYGTDKVLEQSAPKQTAPTSGIIGQIRVIVDALNIRSGAGKEYPSIGRAVKGRVYNVTANHKNLWMEIILDEKTKGWVSTGHEFNEEYVALVR